MGDVFCTYYSPDGETFCMALLFYMPVEKTEKAGIEAGALQAKVTPDIFIEKKTVQKLRAGICAYFHKG